METVKNIRVDIVASIVLLFGAAIIFLIWQQPKKNVICEPFPEVRLLVASDLHYLSPALTDHGAYFTELIADSDGKTMEYSEELLEAFVETVIRSHPDVLVLTGDLTFNGARKSHEDLIQKLTRIEKEGIPVLVLSGNHDLNNFYAASFSKDGHEKVPGISEEEFERLYAPFGIGEAYAKDTVSTSYIWELTKGLRLLMLDVNGVKGTGRVPEETLRWLEGQLMDAKRSGVRVIAFSHQNLLQHSVFRRGYVIENSDVVLQLYRAYGVAANFTGHLHIQHIGEQDGFCEIATSAMSVSPNQYAKVIVRSSSLDYKTLPVDVSGWAKEFRQDSEELLDFEKYAKEFFINTSRRQTMKELHGIKDEERKVLLAEYFARQNYAYFSGHLEKAGQEENLQEEWFDSGTFVGKYLDSIAKETHKDQNRIVLELKPVSD